MQWVLLAVSAVFAVLALMLLIRMALGAWPAYAAFILAAGSILTTGIQGIHYLMTRPWTVARRLRKADAAPDPHRNDSIDKLPHLLPAPATGAALDQNFSLFTNPRKYKTTWEVPWHLWHLRHF
jgi:hypothetical protein